MTDPMSNLVSPQQPRTAEMAERMAEVKGRSLWADARTRFIQNKAAMISLLVLVLIALFAFFGQHLSPWDNETIDWNVLGNVKTEGRPSLSNGHYFGFDESGRDLFNRVVQGTHEDGVVQSLKVQSLEPLFTSGWRILRGRRSDSS